MAWPRSPLADRATIANMAPEYGATCGYLPGRRGDPPLSRVHRPVRRQVRLVEAYSKAQGLFHSAGPPEAALHRYAGARPGRPSSRAWPDRRGRRTGSAPRGQDVVPRCPRGCMRRQGRARRHAAARSADVETEAATPVAASGDRVAPAHAGARLGTGHAARESRDGSVVIAAITSCTNTSNPSVHAGRGLLAKKAVGARPPIAAVGQDQPGAGLEGRHRLSATRPG